MTKIPSVEELIKLVYSPDVSFEDMLEAAIDIHRTALLTELRDSGLLKTKSEIVNMLQDDKVFIIHGMDGVKCHNTLARAIKAHINNLINPSV